MAVCFLLSAITHVRYSSVTLLGRLIFPRPISSSLVASNRKSNEEIFGKIVRLVHNGQSTVTFLQNLVDNGSEVSVSELRHISKKLVKLQHHKHALEILSWMEAQERSRMSPADFAIKLELIAKVQNISNAEEYFMNIPNTSARRTACLSLLRFHVRERATEEAEALMSKLNRLGLIVSCHPYNEMMKLYQATSEFEKVPLVIMQMKSNKIPLNVLSYNLWMSACGELSGVKSMEMIYKEMASDRSVEIGWSTLCTLANIYLKSGDAQKALRAVRTAESKLSARNRLGYFFLMTIYASLGNMDCVLRVWEASKEVKGRITCANYMCILSSLTKLGEFREAERVFEEWESNRNGYDIRVSNVLLGGYIRHGFVEKAEKFHLRTLEKGACPNLKTWEILLNGWVQRQDVDKVGATEERLDELLG